jgi:hypothetical protein
MLKVCYITRAVLHYYININHLSFSPASFDASLTRTELGGITRRAQTFVPIFGVPVLVCFPPALLHMGYH